MLFFSFSRYLSSSHVVSLLLPWRKTLPMHLGRVYLEICLVYYFSNVMSLLLTLFISFSRRFSPSSQEKTLPMHLGGMSMEICLVYYFLTLFLSFSRYFSPSDNVFLLLPRRKTLPMHLGRMHLEICLVYYFSNIISLFFTLFLSFSPGEKPYQCTWEGCTWRYVSLTIFLTYFLSF